MLSRADQIADEAVRAAVAARAAVDYTGGPPVEVHCFGNQWYGYAVPNPEGRILKSPMGLIGGKTWVAIPYLDDEPQHGPMQLNNPRLEWRVHGFQKAWVKPFTLPLTFAELAEEWQRRERERKGVVPSVATAVVRHERDGRWHVRSPRNPDWDGGAYRTKEEAERRLRQCERAKYARGAAVQAALDPWRNLESDVQDALDHAADAGDGWDGSGDCAVKKTAAMPLSEILRYDDYSSWGEWRPGELKDLPPDELHAEMVSFRGAEWARQAEQWLGGDGIPAVVLIDMPSYEVRCLGDGRGRVSLAVGLGLRTLPVAMVTEKKTRGVQADLDDDLPSPEDLDSIQAVKRLAPQLAAAAQTVYDAWQQDEDGYDEELGSGGICDGIAEAMQDVLNQSGVAVEHASFFDEYAHHRYLHVLAREGVFQLDIPHSAYETGGGYSWKKRPDVQLDQHDVWIARVDDLQNWPQYRDAEM